MEKEPDGIGHKLKKIHDAQENAPFQPIRHPVSRIDADRLFRNTKHLLLPGAHPINQGENSLIL